MLKVCISPVICLGVALSLMGCASLEKGLDAWSSKNSQHREYQVKPAWVRQTNVQDNLGFRKINRMTPVLVGDLIIQGNALDGLVAYDKNSGTEKWRLPIPNGVEPQATAIRDRLFVGASDGNFYSVESSTGIVQWTFPTKSENLAAPILVDGVVYVLAGNNVYYALDAATGRQLWLYSRQDTSQFSIRGGSQASFKDGLLYVGFSDGALVALDAKTGGIRWELQLNRSKRFRDIDATPVLDGDLIYVGSYDDKLYCVSATKGEVLWRVDGGAYNPVTVVGDRLIYPTSNGEVWALKKSNGERIWSFSLKEGIATEVKVFNSALVFGESQGSLRFLELNTGKVLGSFEPGRGILSTPLVDEKSRRVYFISGEANLYAINAGWSQKSFLGEF